MKGVLILGEYINALGIARALGKHKIPVLVYDDHPYPICRYSRYCRRLKIDSLKEKNILNFFMNRLKEGHTIIPTDEKWVYFLSKNKEMLESKFEVLVPEWNIVEYCYNKKMSYEIAKNTGIPIPILYGINDDIQFPVFVRPCMSYKNNSKMPRGYKVNNREELLKRYKEMSPIVEEENVLIQEIIGGGVKNNYSFASYFKEGRFHGEFCSRKLKQYPGEFGTGCVVEPITDENNKKKLEEYAFKFLKEIGFYGISEIEFMYDREDDQFKFIEINPRIWMQHRLASELGVDFLEIIFEGEISGEQRNSDVIWIDEGGLIRVMVEELIKGEFNLKDYLDILKRKKIYGTLSLSDPVPAFAQVKNVIKYIIWRGGKDENMLLR
jgi:predicted ATP-grasp superfamily ATP-dependent carboligase